MAVRDDRAGPGKAAGGTSPRVEGKSGIVATGGAEIVIHLHRRRSGRAGGPMITVRDDGAGPGKAAGGTSPWVEGKSGIVTTGGAEIVIHLHRRRSGRAGAQ